MSLAIAANTQTEADLIAPPIRYELSPADIEAKRAAYAALSAETTEGYQSVRLAIADCRTMRVEVEKKRKALKQGALDYGRKVDDVAKQLTSMVEELEIPLHLKKNAVDEERERVKREAEAARQRELADKIRAEHEAQQAVFQAARDAEIARLTAERAELEKERAAMAAEREAAAAVQREAARVEAERVAAARAEEEARAAVERERVAAEQARIDEERCQVEAERAALAAEKAAAERVEFERAAKVRAEEESKARAERERIAAEEARVAELERKAAEERRLAAIRPDLDKLLDLAASIRTLPIPEVRSIDAARVIGAASHALGELADGLVDYARSQRSQVAR